MDESRQAVAARLAGRDEFDGNVRFERGLTDKQMRDPDLARINKLASTNRPLSARAAHAGTAGPNASQRAKLLANPLPRALIGAFPRKGKAQIRLVVRHTVFLMIQDSRQS